MERYMVEHRRAGARIRDRCTGEWFCARSSARQARQVCDMLNAARTSAQQRVRSGRCPSWLYDPHASWPPDEVMRAYPAHLRDPLGLADPGEPEERRSA